jgi:hypothetical protein
MTIFLEKKAELFYERGIKRFMGSWERERKISSAYLNNSSYKPQRDGNQPR